jgi:Cys-tRNA(Pro) deacylase
MSGERMPSTPAVLALRAAGIAFTPHFYAYEEKGGTTVSARELGVDEHAVVKSLVMQDDKGAPLIVLMHGDRTVSTKTLARLIGVKAVTPCAPDAAQRHSGYRVGGTSPFGTRKKMPVYVERSILALPAIYINGGSRGFLVCIAPEVLTRLLAARPVDVAIAQ